MKLTKKLTALGLAVAMVASIGATSVFASEEVPFGNAEYQLYDSQGLSDGMTRASWGKGNLYCTNPVFGNPYGYAETTTFSGTAYKITAQLKLVESNGLEYTTEDYTKTDSNRVATVSLSSKTKSCDFFGYHSIQDTSVSGWQKAETEVFF